jgi:hypothetical protein
MSAGVAAADFDEQSCLRTLLVAAPGSSTFLLETNRTPFPAGWNGLTSNYTAIVTSFVVTDSVNGAARFFRLCQP